MNEKINKCRADTFEHIKEVTKNINVIIKELLNRAEIHDDSKFEPEELNIFAEAKLLSDIEYGSQEYKENMQQIKPATEHHFSKNRHHPQYWPNGINDMNLVDLIELLADWKAATLRNKNGNLVKSIEINTEKYNISPQLKQILENTVRELYN